MSGAGNTELQDLLDLAANGDDAACDQVIQGSVHRLQVLTSRVLKNYPCLRRWKESGDVIQTAVIRLYRSISDVKPESAKDYFGLAATQIRRTLIDLARKHYGPLGQAANHFSEPAAFRQMQIVDQEPAPIDEPATLESWADFQETVDRLPDNERAVFELVWYSGIRQAETADLLGVSVPSVKRRLRSARFLLAEASQRFDIGAENV